MNHEERWYYNCENATDKKNSSYRLNKFHKAKPRMTEKQRAEKRAELKAFISQQNAYWQSSEGKARLAVLDAPRLARIERARAEKLNQEIKAATEEVAKQRQAADDKAKAGHLASTGETSNG